MAFTVQGEVSIPAEDFWEFVTERATAADGEPPPAGVPYNPRLVPLDGLLILDLRTEESGEVVEVSIDAVDFWSWVESYAPFAAAGAETRYGPPRLESTLLSMSVVASTEGRPEGVNPKPRAILEWAQMENGVMEFVR
jgi:hypothetical protein